MLLPPLQKLIQMKIRFRIDYHTQWGEALYICSSALTHDAEEALLMTCEPDGHTWVFDTELPAAVAPGTIIAYRYIVKRDGQVIRREWGEPHRLEIPDGVYNLQAHDAWQIRPECTAFYASTFTEGFFRRQPRDLRKKLKAGHLTLCVEAPEISPSQQLAICGEGDTLGRWSTDSALRMNDAEYPVWSVRIPLDALQGEILYKFVILDRETGRFVAWENGANRSLNVQSVSPDHEAVRISGLRLRSPLPHWKGAGTAIPVFSLRSNDDFGCGDFADLRKMVDWCVSTGQSLIQLLPVNDTTMTGRWTDSYPYNAVSSFALHPIYIRLEEVGSLRDKDRRSYYEATRCKLNALSEVDYEGTFHAKMEFLREIFPQLRKETERSDEYKEFVKANEYWLRDYAAFCALRDRYGTPDFRSWSELAEYSTAGVEQFCRDNADEIAFVYFTQYHLDRQLRSVRDYARSRYVALKGDLPIGVSRSSVEMWSHPDLFHLDGQAGAPPDPFSSYGQNWGFPTYNWDAMLRDGLAWWKARLRKMAEYFDAFRIDHLLGFFRIWQIPLDSIRGLLGTFQPALPYSAQELSDRFGFMLNPGIHCRPCVTRETLGRFFGDYARQAADELLAADAENPSILRPQEFVDTQRKAEAYFRDRTSDECSETLYQGMLSLLENCLFLEDPCHKGLYHPRIDASGCAQYDALTYADRERFDRIYHEFFYERQNDFWAQSAMSKLPALIGATGMLCCGEDLGMIPLCVPEVMHNLQILSLEIQRMPKELGVEFGNTWSYPYLSVCTTSTHDMPGIRGWWASDKWKAQRFYNTVLGREGEAPAEATGEICKRIIDLHLDSPSILCVLPLQDWLSASETLRRENHLEEVINVPANSRHYWRYRMHIALEQLLDAEDFNASLRRHIKASGR